LSQPILEKYKPEEKEAAAIYTLKQYDHLRGDMLELYKDM
jgi:hypothetical protein